MFTSRRMRRALAVAAGITALALVTGCASSQKTPEPTETGATAERGTLRIALAAPPTSLDPANMSQQYNPFAQPAYDALISVDINGNLVPNLATEWGFVDDENKVLEITLREGVTFSDGEVLNADALITHLNYLDNGISNVVNLVNGGTYEKVSDYTVRLSWDTPHPLAPRALTYTWISGMVISPKAITENPEGLATMTAGTGPYVLDQSATIAGSKYVYDARDDYWNPEKQYWEQIVITVIENPDQRLNALTVGEVDYAVGELATAEQAEGAGHQVLYAPTIVYGLSLLDRDGSLGSPIGDVRVRQAINYALDNEAIATGLLGKYGFPTEQTVVPSEPGYVKALEGRYAYDPEKAKALLTEAGYPDGFTVKVIASTSALAALLAQVYVEQLAAVGIELDLDSRPGPDYFSAMTSGEFAVAGIGYGSQPMPMEYDGLFGPNAAFNPRGSSSQTLSQNMAAGLVAPEAEARGYYEAVMTELVEDAWFAPAVFAPVFIFVSSDLAPTQVSEARPQVPLLELRPAN